MSTFRQRRKMLDGIASNALFLIPFIYCICQFVDSFYYLSGSWKQALLVALSPCVFVLYSSTRCQSDTRFSQPFLGTSVVYTGRNLVEL